MSANEASASVRLTGLESMSAILAGPAGARKLAARAGGVPPYARPLSALRNLGDHVVGVAAQLVQLRRQIFGVRPGVVRPAEADDHVGHALILQPPDAVGRVCVD